MIKKAIELGVSKINVNTECQLSFADATRKYIEAGKDLEGKGFDPRKLLAPGTDAIKATVKKRKWNYLVLLEKLNKIRMRRECFCFGGTLFSLQKKTSDDKLPEVFACMKKSKWL